MDSIAVYAQPALQEMSHARGLNTSRSMAELNLALNSGLLQG